VLRAALKELEVAAGKYRPRRRPRGGNHSDETGTYGPKEIPTAAKPKVATAKRGTQIAGARITVWGRLVNFVRDVWGRLWRRRRSRNGNFPKGMSDTN